MDGNTVDQSYSSYSTVCKLSKIIFLVYSPSGMHAYFWLATMINRTKSCLLRLLLLSNKWLYFCSHLHQCWMFRFDGTVFKVRSKKYSVWRQWNLQLSIKTRLQQFPRLQQHSVCTELTALSPCVCVVCVWLGVLSRCFKIYSNFYVICNVSTCLWHRMFTSSSSSVLVCMCCFI